jgi:hypothetical protein
VCASQSHATEVVVFLHDGGVSLDVESSNVSPPGVFGAGNRSGFHRNPIDCVTVRRGATDFCNVFLSNAIAVGTRYKRRIFAVAECYASTANRRLARLDHSRGRQEYERSS